ncbi:zinc-binding alcohol dehydrogenase family protein [Furfurilactobacillus rossiae]|uniref:Zinc-type alcohol dehydrogenase-like protein n=1 Tax=Furfurilactobacillus rossiae DSM 15814 TaxID=1114972 RepID=A0A0R1RKE3_9LACO|nr:zinc-binding alcohol dehydrogenase family protein [Furfurilactobacillus rossiae]KRL57132.1 zinc-binding dehydrogenase [Furfurilactobacillus rossiae DSM 15814]QFR65979.1 zinc-binding alcohol dehydrogenase family protein [Furfurilactobacillus rossiae]QLE61398.1 Bifunctional protein [Furfurilactobacillus rossiae]
MRVIESFGTQSIDERAAMIDGTRPTPNVGEHDVRVKITAVSVNPVDTKLRQALTSQTVGTILGYDAVGQIAEIGSAVDHFEIGDRVFYAGSTARDGANAEEQAVDARLIAHAPERLTDAEAAALPLTSLTASEVLFTKMGFKMAADANTGQQLLIINGAGGVGSVAIQLAKWAGLTVSATASRPETRDWVKKMGATHIFNHREALAPQVADAGINFFDGILILHSTDQYFETAAKLIKPFGHVASIVENREPLPMGLLKNKAASFDWEYMFAKSDYGVDLSSQGQLLAKIAELADQQILHTTLTTTIDSGINADNLRAAHQLVEANKMVGKVVVTGPFNGSEKA